MRHYALLMHHTYWKPDEIEEALRIPGWAEYEQNTWLSRIWAEYLAEQNMSRAKEVVFADAPSVPVVHNER